jgi:iron(III) transport system substrate-binding protein
MNDDTEDGRRHGAAGGLSTRRGFLAGTGVAGLAGTAGCLSSFLGGGDGDGGDGNAEPGLIGSSRMGRDAPGGETMEEMPDLEGSLTLYSGRHRWLVGNLIDHIEGLYDGFSVDPRYNDATTLVNEIENAGSSSDADVFYTVNAGSLGQLAEAGRTIALPDEVLEKVPESYRPDDGAWAGTSGRARTVPYNTSALSESDVPDDVMSFPDTDVLTGEMGWAPSYGSFQAFVTAMRIMEGEDATREWLNEMLDAGVSRYADEQRVSEAVANGEISAGFANHYYIQRVLASDDDAPLATAFTDGDAGAIFNVAGAAVVDTASDEDLAANFVRHLLSAEAQEYFAIENFEYPLIPEVEPVGDLPPVDELNTPEDFDLTRLSELEPTIELMRDVGIQV